MRSGSLPYAELRTASAFSFLDGSSLPEDLITRAAELELPAVALIDARSVYGAPRFYQAARQAGIKALVGAEVALEDPASERQGRHGPLGLVPPPAHDRVSLEGDASECTRSTSSAPTSSMSGSLTP